VTGVLPQVVEQSRWRPRSGGPVRPVRGLSLRQVSGGLSEVDSYQPIVLCFQGEVALLQHLFIPVQLVQVVAIERALRTEVGQGRAHSRSRCADGHVVAALSAVIIAGVSP